MRIALILFSLYLAITQGQEGLNFNLFKSQDRNRDGKLTHKQFIDALNRALLASGIERDKVISNNFGREFLGEKDSDGMVELEDIQKWINSGEILRALEEWKIINEEGEEHFDPTHEHKPRNPKKGFRRAPPTVRSKNDL
ncbi:hypothetical protein SteCoe_30142 [Stentor coeruleus]|uniref:EF-hand domain-containing protein n=1 Tax=Stentor coeruleus TaxID=5963 RepID=A0A1R2B4J5_9CILI|nr:hypothetical protein SteCoe_30142 [Stentor coeruleus]